MIWRRSMPVRSRIQASLVSMRSSRSKLLTICLRQIAAGADDAGIHARDPLRRRGLRALFLAVRLGLLLDDALAAIEAIRRDAMTQVLLARLWIDRQRRCRQSIMRTVHAALDGVLRLFCTAMIQTPRSKS